jgi:ParB family chromosome partitioning protein
MRLHKITDIIISPDRQRQHFDPDALEELKNSIQEVGLMQCPVVRESADGPVLVAGERRLRVITDIYALDGAIRYNGQPVPTGMLPTVTLGELDVLAAEEAELDENLKRKDLTWQELAAAHERLHKLRGAQKLARVEREGLQPGILPQVQINQTVADTAKEIHGRSDGYFQDVVRKELIVAKHLDNPEVAKAKSVDEAFKILKRSEQAQKHRDLALEVGKSFSAEDHQAYNISCLEWMRTALRTQPETSYDVILTDPPYGMGADSFGDGGGKLVNSQHKYDDSHESWVALMEQWAHLSYAIAKPQAHAYVFCDIDRFHELKAFMQAAGWYVFRTPLIDYKTDSGRVPLPDRGPRRQWEMILYAIKGEKPVTTIVGDVIPCQADPNMTHGAQKPVALYVNLLKRSVKPGDQVLDTFAGSGTIFPAAHSLQCRATGIEQEPEYFGMCLKRLKELKAATGDMDALLEGLGK